MVSIQKSVQSGLLRPVKKIGTAMAHIWPWPVRVKICNSRRVYVDLRSRVGRRLFMKGEFDPGVFTPFKKVLKPGGVFVDVGANAGFYSMLALDYVGPTGAVHAFDIDERPLRCLRKTIQAEGLPNLHLHEIAVSEKDGSAHLEMISDCGRTKVKNAATGPQVPTITLDTWWKKNKVTNIQGMKMDIEGGELAALKGAVEMLKAEKPLIVCEVLKAYTTEAGHKPDDVVQFLESIGYKVRWLDDVWFPGVAAEWAGK